MSPPRIAPDYDPDDIPIHGVLTREDREVIGRLLLEDKPPRMETYERWVRHLSHLDSGKRLHEDLAIADAARALMGTMLEYADRGLKIDEMKAADRAMTIQRATLNSATEAETKRLLIDRVLGKEGIVVGLMVVLSNLATWYFGAMGGP